MRAQERATPDVMSAVALMALRAEMEALAAVLPGLWQGRRDPSGQTEDAEVEAQFDNMPL